MNYKIGIACFLLTQFSILSLIAHKKPNTKQINKIATHQSTKTETIKMKQDHLVKKKIFKNGLTVLVRSVHTIPKVSSQLWYGVGSKHELDNERGYAHLLEHMMFKGTAGKGSKNLSESDINVVTHMLSGNCNAFTSYDFTGYLFNFPTHHWQEAFVLLSDCMRNCAFKEDMLDSEMKAVIQELKMYKDNYIRSLVDEMIGLIFTDHPYHHPIIGYKQDLWNAHSKDLLKFYNQHYGPNNATLVVVGDVDPNEVFAQAEHYFGSIEPNLSYKHEEFSMSQDILSKSVTLYRDIKQPTFLFTFLVPGLKEKKDHLLLLLSWILGQGKSSRLYQKLVNEHKLVTSISASSEELFDYGLFFIACEPKSVDDFEKIKQIIEQEIQSICTHGISDVELDRAIRQTQIDMYAGLEDIERQAFEIGKYYLATQDEEYLFNYLNQSHEELKKQIHEIIVAYFRPSVTHVGKILPLPESEKKVWLNLQKQSDELDTAILSARDRKTQVEPARYAKTLVVKDPGAFNFPKPTIDTLGNGLRLFNYFTDKTPKIDIVVEFKAKHYYDPENKLGLAQFVSTMLLEGTKKHPGQKLINTIESHGISISSFTGGIMMSMVAGELPFGLEILNEILTEPLFSDNEIEKVRSQLLVKISNYWDEPNKFFSQLIKNQIYKNHPYSKSTIGTTETINSITKDDLINFHKTYISPKAMKLAIVGDVPVKDIKNLVEKHLGNWAGKEVVSPNFPQLAEQTNWKQEIDYPINRDQIVLAFAGKSISRNDTAFDKLLLFDQIFGGGSLGSMSSRLFELREQSGLFYTISGSLLYGVDEQPGMIIVRTIVSKDRLKEAVQAIRNTIDTSIDSLTEEELIEAKML